MNNSHHVDITLKRVPNYAPIDHSRKTKSELVKCLENLEQQYHQDAVAYQRNVEATQRMKDVARENGRIALYWEIQARKLGMKLERSQTLLKEAHALIGCTAHTLSTVRESMPLNKELAGLNPIPTDHRLEELEKQYNSMSVGGSSSVLQ